MFSLIIVLISIALVVALAAATIYYGGKTAATTSVRTAAATVVNQAKQIAGAGVIAESNGVGWPSGSPSFAQPFLTSMPVPPKSVYADPEETPSSAHWTYYVEPSGSTHHFVLKNKLSREACLAVNREQGFVGIPAVWDGKALIQCFGPGVAARAGAPDGYTFFYDPVGTTSAQKDAAMAQSKAEGGSTTPGYPRNCPDGTNITTGLCPGSAAESPPVSEETPGPTTYSLAGITGVHDLNGGDFYGFKFSQYCSNDMPVELFATATSLTIGGQAVSIDGNNLMGVGISCVFTNTPPALPAGTHQVVLSTPDGAIARGTALYVSTITDAPIITDMSPRSAPANATTTVTITGENFRPGAKAILDYLIAVPVTYISSTQIEVTVPPLTALGWHTSNDYPATLLIFNEDSNYASEAYDYIGVPDEG